MPRQALANQPPSLTGLDSAIPLANKPLCKDQQALSLHEKIFHSFLELPISLVGYQRVRHSLTKNKKQKQSATYDPEAPVEVALWSGY